jgi:hypothetical protein
VAAGARDLNGFHAGTIACCEAMKQRRADSWFARRCRDSGAGAGMAGWRCGGQGARRACVSRSLHGAPFAREPGRCTQHPLRTPDNGEWECIETAGVVTCRSLAEAAGVRPGLLAPAFVCGSRRGSAERICVDCSPDVPRAFDRWECRVYHAAGAAERTRAPSSAPRVGAACTASRACPRDAACVDRRCLPPRHAPAGWYDKDCGPKGRCRWGSCLAKGRVEPAPVRHRGRGPRGASRALSELFSEDLPPGSVAVSPRTQGRYMVEATLSGAGSPSVRRRLSAPSRAQRSWNRRVAQPRVENEGCPSPPSTR